MDFVWNFTLKNNILLVMAAINLAMAIFVISRGWKNKVNFYFSLIVFFTFLWSLFTFMARISTNLQNVKLFEDATSLIGIFIIINILYFSIHFPYKGKSLSIVQKNIIWLPALVLFYFISIGSLSTEIIINSKIQDYSVTYNIFLWTLYSSYFIGIGLWSIYILIDKSKKAEGILKLQIKLLLWAIFIGIVAVTFFNLFLSFFSNQEHVWLGPVFSLLVNSAVFYLIFFSKERVRR